jgi:hypothetical protein
LSSKRNFTNLAGLLGLAGVFSLYPTKMFAGPVTWTITAGTTLQGGASVTGSFQYDADTNTYSDVSIAVGTDYSVPGDTYTTSELTYGSAIEVDLLDSTPVPTSEVDLFFLDPLTDAGGTDATGIHLLSGGSIVAYESPGDIPYNASVSTPEPQTGVAALLGILCLAGVKSRRRGFDANFS